MNITEITEKVGAKKRRKRVGRGEASGHGKTSGRGNKGAGQRAGWKQRLLNEGGAFPLFRRVAKRGFSNFGFGTDYQIVNVSDLGARFDNGTHVTAATLAEVGLIACADKPVKILGNGDLSAKLNVEAQRFSAEAARKIESAGGSVKRLGPQPKKKFIKRPPQPKAEAEADAGSGKKKKNKKGDDAGE
jgi:large subunit ribosomal protein L15